MHTEGIFSILVHWAVFFILAHTSEGFYISIHTTPGKCCWKRGWLRLRWTTWLPGEWLDRLSQKQNCSIVNMWNIYCYQYCNIFSRALLCMQNKRVKALCRCFWLHLNQIILAEKIQIQDTGAKICCFGKYAFGQCWCWLDGQSWSFANKVWGFIRQTSRFLNVIWFFET